MFLIRKVFEYSLDGLSSSVVLFSVSWYYLHELLLIELRGEGVSSVSSAFNRLLTCTWRCVERDIFGLNIRACFWMDDAVSNLIKASVKLIVPSVTLSVALQLQYESG
jgi:hypothetical protein